MGVDERGSVRQKDFPTEFRVIKVFFPSKWDIFKLLTFTPLSVRDPPLQKKSRPCNHWRLQWEWEFDGGESAARWWRRDRVTDCI